MKFLILTTKIVVYLKYLQSRKLIFRILAHQSIFYAAVRKACKISQKKIREEIKTAKKPLQRNVNILTVSQI